MDSVKINTTKDDVQISFGAHAKSDPQTGSLMSSDYEDEPNDKAYRVKIKKSHLMIAGVLFGLVLCIALWASHSAHTVHSDFNDYKSKLEVLNQELERIQKGQEEGTFTVYNVIEKVQKALANERTADIAEEVAEIEAEAAVDKLGEAELKADTAVTQEARDRAKKAEDRAAKQLNKKEKKLELAKEVQAAAHEVSAGQKKVKAAVVQWKGKENAKGAKGSKADKAEVEVLKKEVAKAVVEVRAEEVTLVQAEEKKVEFQKENAKQTQEKAEATKVKAVDMLERANKAHAQATDELKKAKHNTPEKKAARTEVAFRAGIVKLYEQAKEDAGTREGLAKAMADAAGVLKGFQETMKDALKKAKGNDEKKALWKQVKQHKEDLKGKKEALESNKARLFSLGLQAATMDHAQSEASKLIAEQALEASKDPSKDPKLTSRVQALKTMSDESTKHMKSVEALVAATKELSKASGPEAVQKVQDELKTIRADREKYSKSYMAASKEYADAGGEEVTRYRTFNGLQREFPLKF